MNPKSTTDPIQSFRSERWSPTIRNRVLFVRGCPKLKMSRTACVGRVVESEPDGWLQTRHLDGAEWGAWRSTVDHFPMVVTRAIRHDVAGR